MNLATAALISGPPMLLLGALRLWLTLRGRETKVGTWQGTDVIVRRRGRFRELVLARGHDELVQSRQDVDDALSAGEAYVDGFHRGVRDGARRALFLGGGAAIGPRQFEDRYPEMTIDVVENNPVVVAAARRYFGFRESERLALHVMDAAAFVARAVARYDVIVVDVYDARGVPAALATTAFFDSLAQILDDDGVLVVNLLDATMAERIREVFSETEVVELPPLNTLVIATLS